MMIGSIIGDIVGSRFEYNNIKSKEFELFTDDCFFTDDTVPTLAVAKIILESEKEIKFYDFDGLTKKICILDARSMQEIPKFWIWWFVL